jgi:tRNA threonylcarbamoyladenosine biosynthesis protein TsaB
VLLLALDTATPAVTVALHDGSAVIAEVSAVDPRRHGEVLAVFVGQALRKAGAVRGDLTAIAVGTGPGPYTGLRAGMVTARVLGSALQIRTDGICSLDVIAAQAAAGAEGSDFLVATDARRREVYWAQYTADGQRAAGPYVSHPADMPAEYPVAGEGGVLYPELTVRPLAPRYPSAGQLARLAVGRISAGLPPGLAEPLYLRRPDAREPGKPKRVTP